MPSHLHYNASTDHHPVVPPSEVIDRPRVSGSFLRWGSGSEGAEAQWQDCLPCDPRRGAPLWGSLFLEAWPFTLSGASQWHELPFGREAKCRCGGWGFLLWVCLVLACGV